MQRFFGLDCGHFDYLKFLGIGKSGTRHSVRCKYEQRFSSLLSPSLSPERIDESVPGESPLVNEHTGPGEVHHSPCVEGVES